MGQLQRRNLYKRQIPAMVRQYPHVVLWAKATSKPTRNARGFIVPGGRGRPIKAVGRYENFQKGGFKEIINANGETVTQKGVIYIKKGEPIPQFGEKITIIDGHKQVVFEGSVQVSYKGQLNTTLIV